MRKQRKSFLDFLALMGLMGLISVYQIQNVFANNTNLKVTDSKYKVVEKTDCKNGVNSFRCVQFVRNYDGDTIRFNLQNIHVFFGHNIPVRVKGVDAPEMRSKDACQRDKAHLAAAVIEKTLRAAKVINLLNASPDKYFRVDADVIADGQNLAKLLLDEGLAVSYDGGTKSKVDWCGKFPRIIND